MQGHPASSSRITPGAALSIESAASLIERLRRTLLSSNLDCRCRDTLAGALDRFGGLCRHIYDQIGATTSGKSDRLHQKSSGWEMQALMYVKLRSAYDR